MPGHSSPQPTRQNLPTVPCPHCGKPVAWTAASLYRPFCSERCKLIDLGAWASESHRIPGEAPPLSGEEN